MFSLKIWIEIVENLDFQVYTLKQKTVFSIFYFKIMSDDYRELKQDKTK